MKPSVWLTTLAAAALPEILKVYADRLQHIYLESQTRVVLLPFAEGLAQWQTAQHGRAFGPGLEVRWRRLDTGAPQTPSLLGVQFLWEASGAPSDLSEQSAKWSASEWNAVFEATPRARSLLLADHPGATLQCLDYLCDGIVVLTRLCDIRTLG